MSCGDIVSMFQSRTGDETTAARRSNSSMMHTKGPRELVPLVELVHAFPLHLPVRG